MNKSLDQSSITKYGKLDIGYKRRAHNIYKEILEKYSKKRFPKILDVGCAPGIIGTIKKSPKNIYGLEYDAKLAKKAERNCEKVYQVDLNYFKKKDIQESAFDFIFCGDILEHLLDPQRALIELVKLLADNGFVVISLPNIAQIQFRLKLLFGNFEYTETGVLDKTHLHLYTYETARKLITNSDLKIIEFYPSGTIVSFINIFPRLLAPQLIFVCKK